MKIAIFCRKGSFSDGWEEYCKHNGIDYKIIDIYMNDVMQQIRDCDAVMFTIYQNDYRDMQFAISLSTAIETSGKKVFPDTNTCWHFDDKIAQKYLLEAVSAPFVPTYVFYSEREALEWVAGAEFPKVFKLKGGAGSSNVKLARTQSDAIKLIRRAFGKGFKQYRYIDKMKEAYRLYKMGKGSVKSLIRPLYYQFMKKNPNEFEHYHGRESGYVYFQDFIPGNTFDIRVCVVGDKAFAIKRMTRKNDFRASGSGQIIYDKKQIDERCVKMAFDVNRKLRMQSVGFDFVFDNNKPLIVEISYGYVAQVYKPCEGYWTEDMEWHPGSNFDFCGWMVENLIKDDVRKNV